MRLRRFFLLVLLSTVSVLLGACAQVQPWERGTLASAAMALDPTPLQTPLREHVYQSREAGAAGRMSGGGAGCGCY